MSCMEKPRPTSTSTYIPPPQQAPTNEVPTEAAAAAAAATVTETAAATAAALAPAAPAAAAVAEASPVESAPPLSSPTSVEEASPKPAASVASAPAAPKVRASALTPNERKQASRASEIYSIFVATEHLESAYIRGSVKSEDYDRHIKELLKAFTMLKNAMRDTYGDLRVWIRSQGLECPLAEERLLGTGLPATALYGTSDKTSDGAACFQASTAAITLLDFLNLDRSSGAAVDALFPLVRDLQASLVAIKGMPNTLPGLDRILEWLVTLNGLRASDTLSSEQCRQLALDVETAFSSVKNWLDQR
eukprot:CAMPEP_0206459504 /NCGR_PEP_ID=MMETSP0324_2-20121206/24210_1 /ASSEMBLY_ACC=CAM_ASM_000836 /TAXON_ID=2866 /ORGANISM="Crypthecodinium cohnii, Strain Seligo" /LENGTH=304 /DNA_ID=CAMNT_0053931057 /DNA_START=104 /DNA_END=1018 /DNA_ORIENTATION=-